jgi:hypothetical protein
MSSQNSYQNIITRNEVAIDNIELVMTQHKSVCVGILEEPLW